MKTCLVLSSASAAALIVSRAVGSIENSEVTFSVGFFFFFFVCGDFEALATKGAGYCYSGQAMLHSYSIVHAKCNFPHQFIC